MENTSSFSTPDFDKLESPLRRNKVLIENAPTGPSNYFFARRAIDQESEVEKNWKEIWEPIVLKNGKLDMEILKRELFDFSFIIQEASKVYYCVTGGRVKSAAQFAEKVAEAYKENLQQVVEEKLKEAAGNT